MKQLIFLMIAILLSTAGVQAQTFGDFSVRGASGCFATVLDTVSNGTSDTVQTPLNPFRNNVGFEVEVLKVSGNALDSSEVDLWATKVSGGTSGWKLLKTFTVSNTTNKQWFDTDQGGIDLKANPYTGYMLIYRSTAVLANTASWRTHLLIR